MSLKYFGAFLCTQFIHAQVALRSKTDCWHKTALNIHYGQKLQIKLEIKWLC